MAVLSKEQSCNGLIAGIAGWNLVGSNPDEAFSLVFVMR